MTTASALPTEIREHFAAGRLTRTSSTSASRRPMPRAPSQISTPCASDLPALPPSPAEARAELTARRSQLQRQLLQQTGGALGVFVLCCVIWLASGATGSFWPVWVAIFPVLALLQNGWRLYGPAPELDRVEAELERAKPSPRP